MPPPNNGSFGVTSLSLSSPVTIHVALVYHAVPMIVREVFVAIALAEPLFARLHPFRLEPESGPATSPTWRPSRWRWPFT